MAAGDRARLAMMGRLHGQTVQWGLHFQFLTASGTMADLAADFETSILPAILAASSVEVQYNGIRVEDVRPDGPESHFRPFTGSAVGSIAGDSLPGNCAAVVSLHTGLKGGRRRGRFYVPGLAEGNVAGGVIGGTQFSALQSLANGIVAVFGATGSNGDYRAGVYSREDLEATPPRVGTLFTNLTSAVVSDIVGSQRRRRIGVGA